MAAYDNVSLPAPPNIATAGNYAQMLMQGLSSLGDAYQSGQNFKYQQRQNNLFQGGLPTNANGQPDFAGILQKIIQSGGAPAAASVLPMLQKQPFFDQAVKDAQGGGQQPNTGPATSSAASGPANITGATQPQPQLSATGSDSAGAETVRSLTAGIASGRPVQDTSIANYARAIGVDPDTPLSADQEARARQIIGNNLRGAQPIGSASTGGVSAPNRGGIKPVVGTGYEQDEGSTGQGTPVGSTGGSPISPAPTSASGNIGGAPAQQPQSFNNRFGAAYGNPPAGGAAGMVPPGVNPLTYAEALKKRADAIRRQANTQGIIGIPTKAKEDQAAALDKQADSILEQLGKAGELTTEQKNVASGAALKEAQIKDDTTRYGKQLASIQGSAQASNRQLEHIQLAEGLYKNPNFYSGAGEGLNLMYKRVVNALNPNNTEALPQEAFRKTMAAAVLNQVEQLKDDTAAVGGSGRIFQAQIELMEKAANNPDNSVPANRLLTEIAKRGALESKHIAQMANNYKGGHLDAQFAQLVDDYYTKHPMFTDAEMKDIRLIAPPVAPKLDTPEQAAEWGRKAGLKPGDPIKLPSGRIVPLTITIHPNTPGQ
jgi:hypothetical protein